LHLPISSIPFPYVGVREEMLDVRQHLFELWCDSSTRELSPEVFRVEITPTSRFQGIGEFPEATVHRSLSV
jgi:hypothetical protein